MTDVTGKRLVLVYDDDKGVADATKRQIGDVQGFRVELLTDAQAALNGLEDRRRTARSAPDAPVGTDNPFDEADILVVDYDLIGQDDGGPAETGERVAYLARCYSRCKTIVALNQYAESKTFDLTLVGHIGSYADLNISGDQIGNPGLWGRPHDGFLPWSWPNLVAAPALQEQRVALLSKPDALDARVLDLLGLDRPTIANALTRSQLGWLSPGAAMPQQATVRDTVAGGRLGLRPKDTAPGHDATARIAAARLAKWLERLVLPGQNVVVDAPHLVGRYPSLLSAAAPDDTTVRDPRAPAGVGPAGDPHRFSRGPWLTRPAWTWPSLSQDEQIEEVRDPFAPTGPDRLRFAEDSSMFRDTADTRSFAADVEPFSERRATRGARPDETDKPPWAGPYGLHGVSYQPAVRFAL